MMPTGQMHPSFGGFSFGTKSLSKPPKPYFSTKLKPLNSIGKNKNSIIYGDEATPDFTDLLSVLWGDNEPIAVDKLQEGYTYLWNIGQGTLTITDENDSLVTIRKISSWSDLGIEAYILESHQFQYLLDASYDDDVYLIGSRQKTNRECSAMTIMYGEFDQYLKGVLHVAYKRLYDWLADETNLTGSDTYECMGAIEELRTFLKALIINLAAKADFTKNISLVDTGGTGKRVIVDRNGVYVKIANYLMAYTVSMSIMQANKHCYEPWMLWEMFKWLGQSSSIEIEDTIFDLSPMW